MVLFAMFASFGHLGGYVALAAWAGSWAMPAAPFPPLIVCTHIYVFYPCTMPSLVFEELLRRCSMGFLVIADGAETQLFLQMSDLG